MALLLLWHNMLTTLWVAAKTLRVHADYGLVYKIQLYWGLVHRGNSNSVPSGGAHEEGDSLRSSVCLNWARMHSGTQIFLGNDKFAYPFWDLFSFIWRCLHCSKIAIHKLCHTKCLNVYTGLSQKWVENTYNTRLN